MEKKAGFFKELQATFRSHPALAFALAWVAVMPSVGTLLSLSVLAKNPTVLQQLDFSSFGFHLAYLLAGIFAMGLALLPTTFLAAVSGFLFGWEAFGWLFVAYNLAALLGYAWGKKLGGDSLDILLAKYPKANRLLEKKENIGELVFFGRLSPILPFAVSNLFFALLGTGWRKLLVFGSLGMLPRTLLVFWSGTLAKDLYAAIEQEGISGKGWIFLGLLSVSVWGIWRFFTKKSQA
jgi:uncharacterized membrane protein YdjX (TVP38/TMEM64 family)